jgi:hypothetical protein
MRLLPLVRNQTKPAKSFTAGPANIVKTMHLTGKGDWHEVTEATVVSNPPHRSVDMLLQPEATDGNLGAQLLKLEEAGT